ncbi:MAG: bifunctional aconitate hydratase 2/2-methylisocitrate dehydratase [Sulfurimonas sp. RIFCSPHIGHO2_12_FULL_36_9]|uniref:bifunctional aconitate hydratase 2/2-methylisocitrate dehydratase n=1 Tax=Sulfurimonas sp. RIFCSPLOWO2_12_36_12 TaxID=1802253 RepID=UPI0008CB491C|nr:bifunctional aconitate hydratase 2/2-methylisocitrate dehydratase [Sulfurimonas sp. RIFCSPLOWO2_12_36_12]OHD97193.1 MAG: bifunctional aconitate hydratase 2/2-methylisocitrate dehydratase [Sulfurimonas sp. RIFCSPLOWO2_02_FULL_36_28]OHD97948.1 MAG: bifunctional aconitate hydratase 2/2-methylisocitrate dehydratase [Sulfurimonas sp. RIFCSPHIGHO2_12_FULL_36_9]OHE02755.1 MAG: bifunctional aconitate hydratase 2/2-methylisocitrate dehydratase [Sulfurimonas sp. RIFCSPLOWO2_12_36_12]OHE02759.1 MAG: bi
MAFIEEYKAHIAERETLGVPPLPLNAQQTVALVEMIKAGNGDMAQNIDLLTNRVSPGVDDAAYVKAAFLNDVASEKISVAAIAPAKAVEIMGMMLGGYNVKPMVDSLTSKNSEVVAAAKEALKHTLLVYDAFNDVEELYKAGNAAAVEVMNSWANAEWFTSKPALSEKMTLTVFKVPGETNTDDLSPASEAFTRSDIPLHANSMLVARMNDPINTIKKLKEKGNPIAYVGDVVGTGSSRKSGVNSVQWHMGDDIPGVPNKRTGGVVLGGIIAPIFFATCEDSGALPLELDVSQMETGDEITVYPYKGEAHKDGKCIATFKLNPNTITDEVRAGGRIPLIIGRGLTAKARGVLNMGVSDIFLTAEQPADTGKGYTLAQKMVGRACGMTGVRPNMYVEPVTSTVGSQDTTGPMTRDEVVELAALGFSADLVMQSFCHTAAYPKPSDIVMHHTLPEFISKRSGVALRPGDGVIHSWLNRMVLPDTVGTGADSHTRFPIGISFPGGSGIVAFAAVTGSMPLTMPESVLVRFSGELQPGITLRDLVNAIPHQAIKEGHLTVAKKDKKNIFNGRILEIEGLPNLKAEQAFELSDASAERSAAACTVLLNEEPVIEYLKSNVVLLEQMIVAGYEDKRTLQRRIDKMNEWLANPSLMKPDADAEYAAVINIDLNQIKEPILACPNDPDDVATLSEVLASERPTKIDEVFVGSCMTNIGHYRALGEVLRGEGAVPTRLWVCPPTKMDEKQLTEEGYYAIFGESGARTEIPGCSLCMGNQARVADGAVVFSTSTRNFDNRLGKDTKVYLGSAELAAVCAKLGRLPSAAEYNEIVPKKIAGKEAKIYKYLNFNLIKDYKL